MRDLRPLCVAALMITCAPLLSIALGVPRALAVPPKRGQEAKQSTVDIQVEAASIVGTATPLESTSGSTRRVDEKELERFKYNDAHRILNKVPGVYVRDEDGYGLRPNIGLRGANSDRSAKVTLMEDGVLFAPAPYAAPAAYYFPMMGRIVGVSVVKGPGAVEYGPSTTGGAIDLKTRGLKFGRQAGVDLAIGNYRTGRVHGYAGHGTKHWGMLIEGVHLQSEGFKKLPSENDTGFDKNEVTLKGGYRTDPDAEVLQQFEIKIGYSNERSRETYLGLSSDDFQTDPLNRYAASELGLMNAWRTQAQLSYSRSSEVFDLEVVLYRQDMQRSWRKLNRFRSGPALDDILADPSGQSAVFLSVLRGASDSSGSEQALLIGTNDRSYFSQGLGAGLRYRPTWFGLDQELSLKLRLHQDRIRRDHTELAYAMRSATLVPEGTEEQSTSDERGAALAFSTYLGDDLRLGPVQIRPAVRLEVIRTSLEDDLNNAETAATRAIVLPSLGLHYQALPWLAVFGGVHRGFNPVAPGQADEVDPETSINYEVGVRHALRRSWGDIAADVIGFLSDYQNILGQCTFSAGCDDSSVGDQFNGGAALIYGLEAQLRQSLAFSRDFHLDGSAAYTLTLSRFQESFDSSFPQFGSVTEGDELPYVPNHQLALRLEFVAYRFSTTAALTYIGPMRDRAGQGDLPAEQRGADPRAVIDLGARYRLTASGNAEVYLRVDNLLNTKYIASRRPFGARPGRPLQGMLGLSYRWQ